MKAIANRLRQLEHAGAPSARETPMVEAILDARRQRLGADYEPVPFPPASYFGCRTQADHIVGRRKLLMERRDSIQAPEA
jgi:hypothetical protein